MKFNLYLLSFLLVSVVAPAQQALKKPEIPFTRLIWHENIDKTQRAVDLMDNKEDSLLTVKGSTADTKLASAALYRQVDNIQNLIELDGSLDNNGKIKFLRGLNEVLTDFQTQVRYRNGIKPSQLPELVTAFSSAMQQEKNGVSLESLIETLSVESSQILLKCISFSSNPGIAESRDIVLRKKLENNPDKILSTLVSNPNFKYADTFIKKAAYLNPEDLYTYAQSGNDLGRRIRKVDDPLVKIISKLALMNTGRLYFPFLDNLYQGKTTIEEVEKNLDNKYKYYRLLVNTEIDYADRFRKRDTPMGMQTLRGMLRNKAVEDFINIINGLHESPDNIRMKEVEPLNPQELYYLCVMGETEIYTSSYLKVYERIFQRMKNPGSDSLLMSVNFDFFKKFIKMAAGYNTLDDFLRRMDKNYAEILMRSFANGLDKTANLEDAVDVADSYASISNPDLRNLILEEVQSNYKQLSANGDKRGTVIYDILNNIFLSMDSTKNIDVSAKFGIPPVYIVKNESLKDSSGRIIIQQFFYGDKDGNTIFNNFRGAYSNSNWKIVNKPEWIEVSSTKGTPVTIYANKPLNEDLDLDAKAQEHLGDYLSENNLEPTVVIHRGHSYYVSYTIEQLAPSAKVILLGSCGGYHNLHKVLKICPFAHIIASKQVGSGTVNQPMIVNLTEFLRQGKDLNWPVIWKDFDKLFKGNDLFDDYVPPYKNLGAIFIMAYSNVLHEYKS